MADNTAPQGVTKIPTDSDTGRLWAGGRTRRATTTNFAFPASTTTPYSGNTPAGVKVYDAALSYVATAGATGYGEFDMSDATGFEVVISNNASTQTLSGITLKDYDTLPSGVTVPGQSYKTATNVATGASVTLSSLSLANNTAVRLWVPVSQSIGRQLYVNPTYGAAVTAGTGSLEVRVTPTFGQVGLNGSFVPNLTKVFDAVAVSANGNTGVVKVSNAAGYKTLALYYDFVGSAQIVLWAPNAAGASIGASAFNPTETAGQGFIAAGSTVDISGLPNLVFEIYDKSGAANTCTLYAYLGR